jgi:2,4-dienoyl-CoA reductase (NADPH2)
VKGGYERLAAFYAERAAGEVGLIVTGGFAPNIAGWLQPFGARMTNARHVAKHQLITEAVHAAGGKICLQILHAGRYGYHPLSVAPSRIQSPITPFKPWALSHAGIERTIHDFVRCAALAQDTGYDGVEIMGSEGYLINEFIVRHTNHRNDEWGGSYENRIRFPLEIVRRVRQRVGEHFILIYRLSMLDLVPEGSTAEEVEILAKAIEQAGATIINTGIGWHEARIPTIASMVPRGGFAWVTKRLMGKVGIPLVATNRINTPEVAEQILADGCADMVSMARPLLADSDFVKKAALGRADEINTCIACNQACLDHVFGGKVASCLVNPRACHETELTITPTARPLKIAVIGAGPAGMACATVAAQRGHEVHLYESSTVIGGQLNVAVRVPGKEEFQETIRYFSRQIELSGVQLHLRTEADLNLLLSQNFDHVVIAAGVTPRRLKVPGSEGENVMNYFDVLRGEKVPGKSVAIIGAGGIGFDVAEYLSSSSHDANSALAFAKKWGIDLEGKQPGGTTKPEMAFSEREIYLLQRSAGKLGSKLGKTTGWIHRLELKQRKVHMFDRVEYLSIDAAGLRISRNGQEQILAADHIIVCAGQESNRALADTLLHMRMKIHLIGGAEAAPELDAKRAIDQGTRLGATL